MATKEKIKIVIALLVVIIITVFVSVLCFQVAREYAINEAEIIYD